MKIKERKSSIPRVKKNPTALSKDQDSFVFVWL